MNESSGNTNRQNRRWNVCKMGGVCVQWVECVSNVCETHGKLQKKLSQSMLIIGAHSIECRYKQVNFQRREFEVACELDRVGCVDNANAS